MQQLFLDKTNKTPIVLGLGFFDCVHFGHRRLIESVKNIAAKSNAKSAIITFSNNPYSFFGEFSRLIYTYPERFSLFESQKLDFCIPFEFDNSFKAKSREEFLELLFKNFDIRGFVCGHDYKFGACGSGDINYLKQVCQKKSIAFEVVDPVLIDGERVSSTLIKTCITNGDIIKANKLLTSPFFMSGRVTYGRGVGKKIGIPTANLSVEADKLLPLQGVYATKTFIDGLMYNSVTNIGAKPTFDIDSISIESFIEKIDFDLYGKDIKIEFFSLLRQVEKFDSAQKLANQIKLDLKNSKKLI